MKHDIVEKNIGLMAIIVAVVISIGGLVEIVPLMMSSQVTDPVPGLRPYTPLELEGRDVYVSEGCYVCHSQMIRALRTETERYGPYSVSGEFVYDHPHQWGSKRTGPDLARVGGRYTDEWHLVHLINPRDVVPESNMPGFPWLENNKLDPQLTVKKLEAMRILGVPYTDEDIATAAALVQDKTEMEALIAYLQVLGRQQQEAR